MVQGADAPISGLVAMIVAAEILGNSTLAPEALRRRLVFTALSGEPWGNQGSKRLLWELRNRENSTAGLDLSKIDQVGVHRDCPRACHPSKKACGGDHC